MATVTDPNGVEVEVPDDRVYLYARLGWDTPKAETGEQAKTPTKSRTARTKEA